MIIGEKVFSGIVIVYMNIEYNFNWNVSCFCLFEYLIIFWFLRLKLVICYKVYKEFEI